MYSLSIVVVLSLSPCAAPQQRWRFKDNKGSCGAVVQSGRERDSSQSLGEHGCTCAVCVCSLAAWPCSPAALAAAALGLASLAAHPRRLSAPQPARLLPPEPAAQLSRTTSASQAGPRVPPPTRHRAELQAGREPGRDGVRSGQTVEGARAQQKVRWLLDTPFAQQVTWRSRRLSCHAGSQASTCMAHGHFHPGSSHVCQQHPATPPTHPPARPPTHRCEWHGPALPPLLPRGLPRWSAPPTAGQGPAGVSEQSC